MTLFRITIRADKYPTEYNVEASGVSTATARALKEWKKRFKGSRASEWSIRVVKASPIIKEE